MVGSLVLHAMLTPWLSAGLRGLETRPLLLLAMAGGAAAVLIAVPAWQVTGLFRAAEHHMNHVGTIAAARSAQVAVTALAIVLAALTLNVAGRFSEVIPPAWQLGRYDTRLTWHAQGRELEISGGLSGDISQEVARAIEERGNVRRLRLNYTAGGISESIRLADVIRANRLRTIVTTECSGACSIAFLSGSQRAMLRSARLGLWIPESGQTRFPSPHELKRSGMIDIAYGSRARFEMQKTL